MLSYINIYKEIHLKSKRSINITATLATTLTPGIPAIYLYKGLPVRTTAVETILEAGTDHVKFETKDIIYTITFAPIPNQKLKFIA